jgi:hypothetical protein
MSKPVICLSLVVALTAAASNVADQSPKPSFFITSAGPGKGADLGGLDGADRHCAELAKAAGLHDRQGGGSNPTSWNSSHPSRGCGQQNLQATGGNGLFYCFAAN